MGIKGWSVFIIIAAVVLGGLIYFSNANRLDVSDVSLNTIIGAEERNGEIADNVYGNPDAKVILIEYGDFQCPGCNAAYPNIKEVTEKYKNEVAFIFRNLPLTSIHPHAKAAAASAQAAGLQGKYWEMNHLLFENQNNWSSASAGDRAAIFRGYAEQIGLDLEKYDADLTSEAIAKKLAFDQALFRAAGYPQSTPTFVLNGELVDAYVKDGAIVAAGTDGASSVWANANDFDTLIIQPALREAGVTIPSSESE